MRVLVVSQYFWPESFRINDVVKSLVEQGVEVEVLTGKPNYPHGVIFSGYRFWGCQREPWEGAILHRVPLLPRGRNSHLGLLLNYLSFILFGLIIFILFNINLDSSEFSSSTIINSQFL